MPTIEDNSRLWNDDYDWSRKGEEWSSSWGDSWSQWHFCIFPRIGRLLPVNSTLEIAPGFGRWTQYLRLHCQKLIGVDLSPKCVQACRARFAADINMDFQVNDGRSLDVVEDESVDFVFSFDSLVHSEADIVEDYLHQIANKLTPNGAGLIHHSNLAAILAEVGHIEDSHGRAPTMSAEAFEKLAGAAGLCVISQEIICWANEEGLDCLSIFVRKGSPNEQPNRIWQNNDFMREAAHIRLLSVLYSNSQ